MSACRLIELFRAGSLSPVDVLRMQMDRIASQGASLNAITFRHFDEAMRAAQESERRYRDGSARPLEGVTVAVKDEYAKAGWVVTAGCRVFKDDVQDHNHPVIDKLIEAGAVLHVQTTAPELYLIAATWSDLWGVTRNPWNSDCTPGGSSGGSAAVLAAGMATLAIGSDMGGSIRIPCALTGLYGSKPAYGRIASPDASAFVPHASPGPLARDIHDVALLQNVMTGPAPGCPAVLRPKLELPDRFASTPRRIALSIDQGWARLEPDVRACVFAAAARLEHAGHAVEEVELDLDTSGSKLRETIERALFSTAIGASLIALADKKDQLTGYARRFVALAQSLGPTDANAAGEEALRLYKIIEDRVFARGFDALVTPTVATTRIRADYDPTKERPVVAGEPVDAYAGWFLTSLFSLLNWMPVITVPAGRASNGVPVGMQIVTRPYDDILCYEIAAGYASKADEMPFTSALDIHERRPAQG
jgi:Asp-tRNA(Asn)/Glu-tRNA(Gln) amidotransferase A subunit family amidase